MRSNNPVFTRSKEFNGQGRSTGGYSSDPSTWGIGTPGTTGVPGSPGTEVDRGPMTIDSVVQKTGITLGIVVVTAALTWLLTGDLTDSAALQQLYVLAMVGAFGGFGLSLVNSFKRVISPALVIAYAAFEGVFVGAFSKVVGTTFSTDGSGSQIVIGAVVGTFAAVAGTLAAYKFFHIQVGDKFRKFTIAAMFGFVALTLLDVVMSLFGNSLGVNGFGPVGLLCSVAGLGIGILMLIMDFDFVERGVAARLPERESWRAAFGLTVTIVWIYIQLLRILAIITRR